MKKRRQLILSLLNKTLILKMMKILLTLDGRMYKEKAGTTTKVNLVEGLQKENDKEIFSNKSN